MARNRGSDPTRGRWLLAGAAVLVQLALGAVYAWSVFVNPFIDQMGWSRTETSLPFIVTIGVLFVGTLVGGRIQDRIGPRPVVLAGGIIPEVDRPVLEDMGIKGIFGPGTSTQDIIDFIQESTP